MAFRVYTSDVIVTSSGRAVNVNSTDYILITEGTVISAANNTAIGSSSAIGGVDIKVDGTVAGSGISEVASAGLAGPGPTVSRLERPAKCTPIRRGALRWMAHPQCS